MHYTLKILKLILYKIKMINICLIKDLVKLNKVYNIKGFNYD